MKYSLPNIKIHCDRGEFEWLGIGNIFKTTSLGMEIFTAELKSDAQEI